MNHIGKYIILILLVILHASSGIALAGGLPTEEGALGDVKWYVEERIGNKIVYYTHGTVVYGHEFGFYKDPSNCNEDIMWLVFSSYDEKVIDFIDEEVVVLLNIDGVVCEVELVMLYAADTIGLTNIMYFSNWVAGEMLIAALMKSHNVTVQIIEPRELAVLMDIKKDTFDLGGFAASRRKAEKMCEDAESLSGAIVFNDR